jgi:hypothetical protein
MRPALSGRTGTIYLGPVQALRTRHSQHRTARANVILCGNGAAPQVGAIIDLTRRYISRVRARRTLPMSRQLTEWRYAAMARYHAQAPAPSAGAIIVDTLGMVAARAPSGCSNEPSKMRSGVPGPRPLRTRWPRRRLPQRPRPPARDRHRDLVGRGPPAPDLGPATRGRAVCLGPPAETPLPQSGHPAAVRPAVPRGLELGRLRARLPRAARRASHPERVDDPQVQGGLGGRLRDLEEPTDRGHLRLCVGGRDLPRRRARTRVERPDRQLVEGSFHAT